MNARDIALVRESHAWVAPVADQAAAQFYDRVFERAPSVATLFRGDMAQQGARLMAMIGAAVGLLDDMDKLNGVLVELGRRHVGYGVQPGHYEVVGGALLDTLAAALGPAFTADHRLAWAALYGHVSRTMQAPSTVAA
ncbi:globin domain-containing protein [Roseateles sp.]|uniref:globin domain-containing protein n=1 Tax=Roseateles sp. TaxID=1971397 RepID=UPI003263A8EA